MHARPHCSGSPRSGNPAPAAGLLATALSGLVLAASLDQGWVPHDTGQLGQSAERVLRGELPHRDFDEPYTGRLSDLHELAFRIFGVRAEATRWTLAAYSLLYVAAVHLIPPALVVMGAALVLSKDEGVEANRRRQALLMLGAVTAMTSLVQFPYGYGTYFFCAAPLRADPR